MSALELRSDSILPEPAIGVEGGHDPDSPYTVSILSRGVVTRNFVANLADAKRVIDRAEATRRCRSAAIVDRNGRHIPRRPDGSEENYGDHIMNTQISEYSQTAAALEELRGRYAGVVYQVETPSGLKAARKGRAELRGLRVRLEKTRVEVKAPYLKQIRLIDGEAKAISRALTELEQPIDDQIKIEEARKAEIRRAKEEARLQALREELERERAELERQRAEAHAKIESELAEARARLHDLELAVGEHADATGTTEHTEASRENGSVVKTAPGGVDLSDPAMAHFVQTAVAYRAAKTEQEAQKRLVQLCNLYRSATVADAKK